MSSPISRGQEQNHFAPDLKKSLKLKKDVVSKTISSTSTHSIKVKFTPKEFNFLPTSPIHTKKGLRIAGNLSFHHNKKKKKITLNFSIKEYDEKVSSMEYWRNIMTSLFDWDQGKCANYIIDGDGNMMRFVLKGMEAEKNIGALCGEDEIMRNIIAEAWSKNGFGCFSKVIQNLKGFSYK